MSREKWATIDCGRFPSEKNCRIKMTAPADQVDELVDLACSHACDVHGEEDSPKLHDNIKNLVEYEMK